MVTRIAFLVCRKVGSNINVIFHNDWTNMEAFLIQDGSYIDASYDEILQEFISMDGYIQDGFGLNQKELSQLHETSLQSA